MSDVLQKMDSHEKQYSESLAQVNRKFLLSARNLIHYLSLRTQNLRAIQDSLSDVGLSSLTHPEAYAYKNVHDLRRWLGGEKEEDSGDGNVIGFKNSRKLLTKNTNRLFGRLRKGKKGHIMVTMPTEAAEDYPFVKNLIEAGMDIARINMSHDSPDVWHAIVSHVRVASDELEKRCKIYVDLAGPKIRNEEVFLPDGELAHPKKGVRLFVDDQVVLAKNKKCLNFELKHIKAFATISIPSIIDDIEVGHRIWFDDGKMSGIVDQKEGDAVVVHMMRCKLKGDRFRAGKGINLPETKLTLPSLMPADLDNLDFVAEHADIVGYSFVRTKDDVSTLLAELDKRNVSPRAGIVLKIENNEAYNNLPDMILESMRLRAVGVMIARGDLAVELGFERISEVQQEILAICESAHIPIIWATQVLENLAKKGLATRAEISDVALAARAECVMLNKGPYILEAVHSLTNILQRMSTHLNKTKYRYRPSKLAKKFFKKMKKAQSTQPEPVDSV